MKTISCLSGISGFKVIALALLLCASEFSVRAQQLRFDVIHYDAQVEPEIAGKSVRGKVVIRISTSELQKGDEKAQAISDSAKRPSEIELNCGELVIDSVREAKAALRFIVAGNRLTISLPPTRKTAREIAIEYHGTPRRGIRFFPERDQVYTVFSTSQWLPCVDAPDDKATVRMRLVLPRGLTAVANGRLIRTVTAGASSAAAGKIVHEWLQDKPIPTYIFGFAAGRFITLKENSGRPQLHYLASIIGDGGPNATGALFTADEVRRIFRDTRDMIGFYEDRSGVPYADATYTQVLAAGGVEQEMSSFTALRDSYGREVLANQRSVWLGAHELAHQWWGNMVTCRDWNHFWLNEGIATFMAAAYLEHRYGREEYLKEIETYRAKYEKVRAAGKDKSLVFPDWLHPTSEDRTLVYDKGAYVMHLLREELGDDLFWSGMRLYTRHYWTKSVTTPDFQRAMEQGSGKRLEEFFRKWVY